MYNKIYPVNGLIYSFDKFNRKLKYRKRIKNRQMLHNKLKKLGRKL